MELFRTSRLDGTYLRLIKKIKRSPLLILDDFGLAPFDTISRQTMMDLVEDRHEQASMIISSQIPVAKWHELIGEGTIADAILDRIVNSAHRITLTGNSLRKKEAWWEKPDTFNPQKVARYHRNIHFEREEESLYCYGELLKVPFAVSEVKTVNSYQINLSVPENIYRKIGAPGNLNESPG